MHSDDGIQIKLQALKLNIGTKKWLSFCVFCFLFFFLIFDKIMTTHVLYTSPSSSSIESWTQTFSPTTDYTTTDDDEYDDDNNNYNTVSY